jgi:hypothetical protein
MSAALAEQLIANLDEPGDKPLHELLSDREHEVMKMIAAGVPLTEIGDALHVSVKTISTLSSAHHGENADEEQCRIGPLRDDAGIGGLVPDAQCRKNPTRRIR